MKDHFKGGRFRGERRKEVVEGLGEGKKEGKGLLEVVGRVVKVQVVEEEEEVEEDLMAKGPVAERNEPTFAKTKSSKIVVCQDARVCGRRLLLDAIVVRLAGEAEAEA